MHDFQSVLTHGAYNAQQQQQQQAPDIGGSNSGGIRNSSNSSSTSLMPLLDLPTGSKVSCLSFSPSVQQYLLSSDYGGVVQLWDLTGAPLCALDTNMYRVGRCWFDCGVHNL